MKNAKEMKWYRIPADLARRLMGFEEASSADNLKDDLSDWKTDKISDKVFIARMEKHLAVLKKTENLQGDALSRAIQNAATTDIPLEPFESPDALGNWKFAKDIEWPEPMTQADEGKIFDQVKAAVTGNTTEGQIVKKTGLPRRMVDWAVARLEMDERLVRERPTGTGKAKTKKAKA